MSRWCRLHLLRHGETDWNVAGRWQGHSDVPLNEVGRRQALEAQAFIPKSDLAAIYCSDLERARETARLALDPHVLPMSFHDQLREVRLGAWEGLTSDEIIERYPQTWQNRQENPLQHQPPGGESLREVADRMISLVSHLVHRHLNESILLVSHGMALSLLYCHHEGIDLRLARDYIQGNATLRTLTWRL